MSQTPVVTHQSSRHRYEIHVDGALAGYAEYESVPGTLTFTHTLVFDEFSGQGLASILVRAALEDVQTNGGLKVVPQCWYVQVWLDRHPDYAHLVADLP